MKKKSSSFIGILEKNIYINKLSAILVSTFMLSGLAMGAEKDAEDPFVRTGTISFSKKYILAEDFRHIIFKIQNHNPRTLTQIFGWVYRIPASKEESGQDSKKLILVNNPHQGGLLVKDGPHRPGQKALWRFQLDHNMHGASVKDTFTLRVSPKSVFFPSLEPPPLSTTGKKKKGR